jgi:FdhE protein
VASESGIKAITEELKKHRGANPELEKLIDLYEEIFKIQESSRLKAGSAPVISPGEALAKLLNGQYVIEKKALQIDPKLYRETALALGEVFNRVSGRPFPVEELLSLPRLKPEAASKFAADILANKVDYVKEFAKNGSFNEETIFFFLLSLIVPFFQAQADNYAEVIKEASWTKCSCPFCGSPPRHARLEGKDSQRYLYCPLCRSQWRFPRMKCPFCNNAQHDKLRYFFAGEDKSHRVDVCDVCKRYIKTTIEKAAGRETLPQVEEAVCLHLDFMAAKEGYQRD